MPRHVAFLRGVSPVNAKMPELKRIFEAAGFTNVKTLLSSGNVAFDARAAAEPALERRIEAALEAALGRRFMTIVRRSDALRALLEAAPHARFALPPGAKRIVTFLREARPSRVALPLEEHGASVLAIVGREVISAYVATERGPVFMTLIERAFGSDVTTRTWDTVAKCAVA